ncbi:PDZ domain-containing protein [Candidatus Peregrinibacteria bacterium]|nr:PDZ domain-containing protein [Candidatus Peregrinibacteria bacterium]MBI3816047.1 PDZ domain-containing protein [Candidatus Peregrinibacteria bacterium]
MRSSRSVTAALLPVLTLFLGLQIGMVYEVQKSTQRTMHTTMIVSRGTGNDVVIEDPQTQADLSFLWTVWQTLLHSYIAPQDLRPNALVFGAAEGLVRSVGDPYTVLMSAKQTERFRQTISGTLEGIGAELKEKDHLIVVVAPLKGSPAEKSGLRADDVIAAVDGTSVEGLSLTEVVSRIRGSKGTPVKLTVYRRTESKPLTLTIIRAAIQVPSVESTIVKTQTGALAVLTLNEFGENSMIEVRSALQQFKNAKPAVRGIVLDLRDNGGGLLEGAVELTSMFVKKGTIVSVEHRGEPLEVHDALGHPLFPDLPMAVLVNEGTASSSEITAGALQDLGRATIIGMKTYGKGTVQEVLDLPGGSSLRVTVARWLTPKGKNLGKEGVMPDIVVDLTTADIDAKKDRQMDAAVEWLTSHRVAARSGTGVER